MLSRCIPGTPDFGTLESSNVKPAGDPMTIYFDNVLRKCFLGLSASILTLLSGPVYPISSVENCRYLNGVAVSKALDEKLHCRRGFVVKKDEDFCPRRDPLSSTRKDSGVIFMGPPNPKSSSNFGVNYKTASYKCLPNGLALSKTHDWCQTGLKIEDGRVIRRGQPCSVKPMEPMDPSN